MTFIAGIWTYLLWHANVGRNCCREEKVSGTCKQPMCGNGNKIFLQSMSHSNEHGINFISNEGDRFLISIWMES